MKRGSEDDEAEDVSKRVRLSDESTLHSVRERHAGPSAGDDAEQPRDEMESVKRRYMMSYLKRAVKNIPDSQQFVLYTGVDEVDEDGPGGFYKMYSIAKMCVNYNIQLKKLLAFHSVFNMLGNLVGKAIHDRVVVPSVGGFVGEEHLRDAYDAYQRTLAAEDKASTELHCVSYLIQTEIENSQPLKVPNPMSNRVSQHIKAVSQYVTSILSSVATRHSQPPPEPPGRPEVPDFELVGGGGESER